MVQDWRNGREKSRWTSVKIPTLSLQEPQGQGWGNHFIDSAYDCRAAPGWADEGVRPSTSSYTRP